MQVGGGWTGRIGRGACALSLQRRGGPACSATGEEHRGAGTERNVWESWESVLGPELGGPRKPSRGVCAEEEKGEDHVKPMGEVYGVVRLGPPSGCTRERIQLGAPPGGTAGKEA